MTLLNGGTVTLFDLTYLVGVRLGVVREGIATGGSTTTLIDTVMLTQANDYWNKGTAWALRASTPEYAIVTDFVLATNTATVQTLASAFAAGQRYALANERYPLHLLVSLVNRAVGKLGPVLTTDDASLSGVAGKTEFVLPAVHLDLKEVWVQTNDDADDRRFRQVFGWRVEHAATGDEDSLVLANEAEADMIIRLVYYAPHPALTAHSSELSDQVPYQRVVGQAALDGLTWRMMQIGSGDPTLKDQIGLLQAEVRQLELRYPLRTSSRVKMAAYGEPSIGWWIEGE